MRITITPKQLQVLQAVANFQANNFYSATMAELAAELNVSRPTVHEHIGVLAEKKLLTRSTGKARSLKLTAKGKRLLEQVSETEQTQQTDSPPNESFSGPDETGLSLAGTVSAGYGIEAIEQLQPFSLKEVFGNRDNMFVLQVSGQSMINAGINDGDFVVCKSAAQADNGQLVVALIEENNATLKRFYKDKRAARLMPENDAFEPILSRDCQIQAVVIGLVRSF